MAAGDHGARPSGNASGILDAMRIIALAFLAGTVLVQRSAALDGVVAAAALGLVAALGLRLALVLAWGRGSAARAGRWIPIALAALGALAAGAGWAAWRAEVRLSDELAGTLDGVELQLRGRVAGLPRASGSGWRFDFEVEPDTPGVPGLVQLAWRPERTVVEAKLDAEADSASPLPLAMPRPGERWALTVRLWRPHGFANPSGFDYEAWLLERGVRATGSVRGTGRLLDELPATWMQHVHRVRATVRERILAALPDGAHAGLLVALAVGDQQGIDAGQWEIFRRTGVAHLVSISGLHVALVAMFCGGLAGAAWRRQPALVLRVPVQQVHALGGLAGATAYALLAGMGVPVLRAWLMLLVGALALIGGRRIPPSRVLAIALLVVLVVDPWAVLSAGFWLSFGAVAVILAVLGGRVAPSAGWRAALRVQLAISFALVPLLLAQFQAVPLLSPLANLVAIPLVSFVVTPLVLLAIPWPIPLLLVPADFAAGWMMDFLAPLAALERAMIERAAPPPWLFGGALAAVAILLLPRASPGRLAAPALLAALLSWQPARPQEGGFRAWVLDVGQGLAVHVQTRAHDLLYDSGPPFGSESDAGERVVLPWLRAAGVRRLDRVVLSHPDSDHVGGAASLLAGLPVGTVLAGQAVHARERAAWAARLAHGREPADCARVPAWERDGVRFEILHPAPVRAPSEEPAGAGASPHDNDASCVLRVVGAAGALLLTGDIGTAAEAKLIARQPPASLSAAVVVSAHHGSRSSSSAAFVDATLPEHAVHSAGSRNSFGHPHPEVWARWAEAGARNWRTDAQGAIRIDFAAAPEEGVQVNAEREMQPRYWHGR
ncbi:DNA internalization-related competence protein ComEC/Rec2 [Thauera aminoaromatica]|uniref:DNA internalization-related competence protein ComEC/Rec2 n=3 Tax=Thauera aminoaromatica TaxID=164330 RepID=C4ZNY3_THASP|nr:DNA internalization-related competence protein ComEC/Rec2 [Thauera aminoaromatica]